MRHRRVLIQALRSVNDDAELRNAATSLQTGMPLAPEARGDDTGLYKYHDHLQASLAVCLAFGDPSNAKEGLEAALTKWNSMMNNCLSWSALENYIDDVDTWLSQLESMADYFDMHGLHKLQISTLSLMTKSYEAQKGSPSPKMIQILVRLGLLFLHRGYSGNAGFYLAKARARLGQEKGLHDNLHCELAYIEYFLALGDVEKA